jgi:Ca-activated chloride channel family protein
MVSAINGLNIGGSTSLDLGLKEVQKALPLSATSPTPTDSGAGRQPDFALVFTDGVPNDESKALAVANELREKSVKILVVHTTGAPHALLVSLTGDASLVFPTSAGNFAIAFGEAEKIIEKAQIGIVSEGSEGHPILAFLKDGGWFAVLAIALSLALALAQNSTLLVVNEGKMFRWGQATICCVIGLLAGFAAGVGNMLFRQVSDTPWLSFAGGVVAWTVLGGAIGFAMVFVILNFKPSRAIVGGLIGGLMGGLVFNLLRFLGDHLGGSGSPIADGIGRLIGAVMLGAIVGCFIAVVERLSREAYIVIHWGPNETSTLNLGQKPVTIGGREDSVFVNGVPAGSLSIVLDEGRITCTQQPGDNRSELKDQSRIDLGKVEIVVHAKS